LIPLWILQIQKMKKRMSRRCSSPPVIAREKTVHLRRIDITMGSPGRNGLPDKISAFKGNLSMKRNATLFLLIMILSACRGAPPPRPESNAEAQNQGPDSVGTVVSNAFPSQGDLKIKAEVWADNWFAFYSGDQLIREDSVPITTERSFNSETFTFNASYPLVLNFIAKDFKENDSGLEYIGTNRQQMGDGGLIAQFTNVDTGQLIAVTDSTWTCTVIHEAPLDKSCENESNPVAGEGPCGFTSLEEPIGWKDANFDSSTWSSASIYTASQVSPKEGYDQISWDPSAQFIWGPDLETDNTILCRLIIAGP
jgi:hypothetical protein